MEKPSPKFGLTHVNHVIYPVKDMNRSLPFYRDLLGIEQIPSMVDSTKVIWLQLPSGVMLHLIETENAPALPPVHIAFEVADFDEAVRAVEGHGIEVLNSGTRHDGQRYLFFYDPDGNRVELCTPSGFKAPPQD